MAFANNIFWYAVRVTYCREMIFKKHLDALNIENFIPMQYTLVEKGGKKRKKLVPVIHNLIFIKVTRGVLDGIKQKVENETPIRYIIDKAVNRPVTVPDKQMENFINVSKHYDEQIVYLDISTLKKGDKVRITGGPFSGIEGEFLRVKGDRRVVVNLENIMAVATAFIHPSLIEILHEQK
ncbi:MAG: UpxY family transcription antiterminator [Prevotellaceae bacterium]|jgi:transcription antitermination factor NusG|nr:UpxY family transcription antiterminator [Prevotellaceae bacterium]